MIAHMEWPLPELLAIRKQNLPADWTTTQQEQEMLVPSWLLNLIYKCLEKKPEQRYGNGMDLYDALKQHNIANDYQEHDLSALQKENAAMQKQLEKLQQTALLTSRSQVTIPKKRLIAATGVVGLLLIFSVYSLSSKKTVYYPVTASKTNYQPFQLISWPPPGKSPSPVVSSKPTTPKKHVGTHKRKSRHKKFLGLF